MLKFKVTDLETVDEAVRSLYKETTLGDETYHVLQVEGVADADRVKELNKKIQTFRSTNVRLTKLVDVFAKANDIEVDEKATPEELADTVGARISELTDNGKTPAKIDKKTMDAEVAKRTDQMRKEYEANLKEAKGQASEHYNRLSALEINNAVISEATKIGLADGAAADIVARARQIFTYQEGKVLALEEDGETPKYSKDGISPLTINEWVKRLSEKDGKHLFKPNSGGGASGGTGGAGLRSGIGPNPWKKESWNSTKQMTLIRTDLPAARRLAEEAGRPLPAVINQ